MPAAVRSSLTATARSTRCRARCGRGASPRCGLRRLGRILLAGDALERAGRSVHPARGGTPPGPRTVTHSGWTVSLSTTTWGSTLVRPVEVPTRRGGPRPRARPTGGSTNVSDEGARIDRRRTGCRDRRLPWLAALAAPVPPSATVRPARVSFRPACRRTVAPSPPCPGCSAGPPAERRAPAEPIDAPELDPSVPTVTDPAQTSHAIPLLRRAERRRHRPPPCRCAVGWPAGGSTASTWPSSTCATAPVWSSAWSTASVDVRNEYVVRVTGTVQRRPEGNENTDIATGDDRDRATATVEILSAAEPPPFPLSDRIDVDENQRLRYRYLDLRRDRLQRNLRTRARSTPSSAHSMEEQGFLEIETPMLIASTPEGARDFVVPSPAEARLVLRPAADRPSCSSSCPWSAASTATTRSPGACATRTCGPTASSSSPSSTPRPASSSGDDVRALHHRGRARRGRGGHR